MQTRSQATKTENAPSHADGESGHAPLSAPTRPPLWARRLPLQAKLTINQPGDLYEQEADRVAAQVMRMPDAVGDTTGTTTGRCARQLTLQRKSDAAGDVAAPPSVHATLRAPGQPLDGGARAFMESRFGQDFGGVRVHTDSGAAASARAVGAQAYTVGQNVVFGEGRYAPGTTAGNTLIAHELAHVVQQAPPLDGEATVRRFGSTEHVEIGNRALPGENVLIVGYGTVSYGEMIAMAGDYFESLIEMQVLARSYGRFGRQQIDFARWKVNPSLPRPTVDAGVEEAVNERYYRLAARNETHFSTGSAAGRSNREQYIEGHARAIRAAYSEGMSPLTVGLGWQAQEAFANHFLTDAFSGGHIRTPRGQIQAHWRGLYPNFRNNLVQLISCYMASYINDVDNIGYVATVPTLTSNIAPKIVSRGGPALGAFSIEDLISLVMHDADNQGLDVVSPRGPGGSTTGSPFRWRAVGDSFLYPSTPNAAATQTQQMVEEAVRLSYQEARQASSAGSSGAGGLAAMTNPANFRALALLPSEDTTSTTNPLYSWRATSIATMPANLRSLIADQFTPGHEVRSGLDAIVVPPITSMYNFDLHTGDAWNCFTRLLLADPLRMIERIGDRDTCPPGNNNPCP